MHYSTLLLAGLPLIAAVPIQVVETVTSVIFTTSTLTITANGQLSTTVVDVASTITASQVIETPAPEIPEAPVAAFAAPSESVPEAPVASVTPEVYSAPVVESSQAPSVPSSSPVSSDSGNSGSSCPSDSSSPMSGGVNGNAGRSMLDSVNYIRKLYNPNAKCLSWSPTLATASSNCANSGTESLLRANSAIVSDNSNFAVASPYFTGSLATTDFERSLFVLLCQSPDDAQLQGQCPGKVGEIGCSSGACTGHHEVLVDAAGEYEFAGAGVSFSTNWMSVSFSKTCDIFGSC